MAQVHLHYWKMNHWRPFRLRTLWKSLNGPFANSKCTRALGGTEGAGAFTLSKWTIGGRVAHLLFENRSMIHIPIVNAPAPSTPLTGIYSPSTRSPPPPSMHPHLPTLARTRIHGGH